MSTTVKVLTNGPLQVLGEMELQDGAGQPIATKPGLVYLCRCGASKNKPLCDGAHKATNFTA